MPNTVKPNPLFGPDGWKLCTPQSLRGHVGKVHLKPNVLALVGVPLFDGEIAQHRGIHMAPVARKAIALASQPDDELDNLLQQNIGQDTITPDVWRTMLIRTVRMFDHLGLVQVNWTDVYPLVPEARGTHVDMRNDTNDASFYRTVGRSDPQVGVPDPTLAANRARELCGPAAVVDLSNMHPVR